MAPAEAVDISLALGAGLIVLFLWLVALRD